MAERDPRPEGPPEDDQSSPPGETGGRRLVVELSPGEEVLLSVGIPREAQAGKHRISLQIPAAASAPTVRVRRSAPSSRIATGTRATARSALAALTGRLANAWQGRSGNVGGWPTILFILSLGIYALTRLYRLVDFPIYFFTDEAVQSVLAADFLRDNFHDYFGTLLPTYFESGGRFCIGPSIYLQLLPTWLLGKSILVNRAGPALISLLGSAAVALTLKRVFRTATWWSGVFWMAITPVWFLHSRTAFDYNLMVSFFAWFLYAYLRYRTDSARFLYPALLFGALTFYSYTPGQALMLAGGVALLILDLRYHWQQRRTALPAAVFLIALAAPYLRFRIEHPQDTLTQLRQLDSYWLHSLPISQKLSQFVSLYARSLSPAYWYLPHAEDLPRHSMDGFGHILWVTFPFALLGLVQTLRRMRSAAHRILLVALLVTPVGAAIVGLGVTRAMAFVIPAALLTGLGIEDVVQYAGRRLRPLAAHLVLFAILAAGSLGLLATALRNGPLWYRDYGMGGMQFGAQQIFSAAEEYLEANPDSRVLISANWANGTDVLLRFFFPDGAPVYQTSTNALLEERQELSDEPLLILTANEVDELRASPKVGELRTLGSIPYPDGSPGFYLLHMTYSAVADELFAQERAARLRPVVETITVNGERMTVEHPYFDSGGAEHLFDGDTYTFVRGFEANPLVLRLAFDLPRPLRALRLTTGSMDFSLVVRLYAAGEEEPVVSTATYEGLPPDPTVEMVFGDPPLAVARLEIEILHLNAGESAKIHVRELVLE